MLGVFGASRKLAWSSIPAACIVELNYRLEAPDLKNYLYDVEFTAFEVSGLLSLSELDTFLVASPRRSPIPIVSRLRSDDE